MPKDRYPSGFPSRLDRTQSAVPSQETDVPTPYDPSRGQADIEISRQFSRPVPQGCVVRHTMDSRPQFGYDWFWEQKISFDTPTSAAYIVPPGFNLIVRNIVVSFYPATSSPTCAVMTPWGDNNTIISALPIFNILVNNVPTPMFTQPGNTGFAGVPLLDGFISDTEIPCFVVVPESQSVIASITNFSAAMHIYIHYSGTMLLSLGREPMAEVGNLDPLAVTVTRPDQ